MKPDKDSLVLDVWRQENNLFIGVHEKGFSSPTVKNYLQKTIDLNIIQRLCSELLDLINQSFQCSFFLPDESFTKSAYLLCEHLLPKPVRSRLAEANSGELALLMDEELMGIPWEFLHDGNEFLCLKFNLGRLIKTKRENYSPQYRSLNEPLRMLILADPTSDLPSAYLEGIRIKKRFDQFREKIRIDFKSAPVELMFLKKNFRDYDLVHYAGHCDYEDKFLGKTGWILSDGRFTAEDVLEMGQSGFLPALVFSNACQSAFICAPEWNRNNEKVYFSLASAFIFSGSRHYLGTLWKTDDKASLLFAEAFYRYLILGSSVGESVRLARMRLIEEFGRNKFFWSNYLLYGEPGHIFFSSVDRKKIFLNKIEINKIKNKLKLKGIVFLGAALVFSYAIFKFLPSINPSIYFKFYKAKSYLNQGKNEEAIALARSIFQKEPKFLSLYPVLAEAYHRQGDLEKSLQTYFDYSLASGKVAEYRHLAAAYIGLAWNHQQIGDYPKAYEFYIKALEVSKEHDDKFHEAQALRKLAVWYIENFEYEKALELLFKSSEINRERSHLAQHRHSLACDYFDIALVFENKDDYAEAKKFYQKSFEIFRKLKSVHELSDYYFNLGEIFCFQKEFHKAIDLYNRGIEIDQQQNNFFNLVSDYQMRGELYLEMGKLDLAEADFLKALRLAENLRLLQQTALINYDLGIFYRRKNDYQKSLFYLKKAKEVYYSLRLPIPHKIKKDFEQIE